MGVLLWSLAIPQMVFDTGAPSAMIRAVQSSYRVSWMRNHHRLAALGGAAPRPEPAAR